MEWVVASRLTFAVKRAVTDSPFEAVDCYGQAAFVLEFDHDGILGKCLK